MPHRRIAAWAGFTEPVRQKGDGNLTRPAVVGLGWLILYAILTVIGQRSASFGLFVGNILYLLPITAAAVLSVLAARRTQGRVRIAWRLLVVSNLLWLAGEVIWSVYAYATPEGAPTPSVADVGFLLEYVVALPAILIGLGLGVLGRARGLLDALLVAAAVGAIGWRVVIGPLVPGRWDAAALTTFLYPVFAVSIVSILIAVVLSRRQRVPRSMILVGASFGIAAVTDAGYNYLTVLHSYTDTSWLNLGWQAEAVLFCLAALLAARRMEGDERLTSDQDMTLLPALVAFVAVSGLAITDLLRQGQVGIVTVIVTLLLFLGLLLRQIIATRDRVRLTQQLRTAAITDSLTGLYNRRFFEELLQFEARIASRQQTPLSLIMVDLDRFKQVNDAYGHAVGDAVLVEAAHRLRDALRAKDVISRYGGEEFVCLLPETSEQAALDIAERLRTAVSRTPVAVPGLPGSLALTASLGVAAVDSEPRRTPAAEDGLVNEADQAVYRAKAQGRNRVVGSGRSTQVDLDLERELPPALVWLADEIDHTLGDREHSAAVSRWSVRTSARLGLEPAVQTRVGAAARVHDIGKVTLGKALLIKPKPDERDWARIRRHPEESARLITEFGNRPDLARLVAAHHERFDGAGYPLGLAGTEIPIEARIITVCDAWAAMRTNRTYAVAITDAEARRELLAGRGTQFDPAVVDAFLDLVDEGAIDEPALLAHPARPPEPVVSRA